PMQVHLPMIGGAAGERAPLWALIQRYVMDGAVRAAAIEVSGVRKAYGERPSMTVALDDVSLAVAAGSFVSLIGPSGCGKSTLLRLAAGLEAPDHGTVRVHDVAPREAAAA